MFHNICYAANLCLRGRFYFQLRHASKVKVPCFCKIRADQAAAMGCEISASKLTRDPVGAN